MTSDAPYFPPNRQQLVEHASEWLARQPTYPRPVIAALVAEFELTLIEASAALRHANQIRDKAVSA